MKSTVVDLRKQGIKVRVLEAGSHIGEVQKYGIRAVPGFVYERDGEMIRKKTGRLSQTQMKRLCRDGW